MQIDSASKRIAHVALRPHGAHPDSGRGLPLTYDYPDCGFGPMPNGQVQHATLVTLAASTAHVMPVADLCARLAGACPVQEAALGT